MLSKKAAEDVDGRVFIYGLGGYNGQNAKLPNVKSLQELITELIPGNSTDNSWESIVTGITGITGITDPQSVLYS